MTTATHELFLITQKKLSKITNFLVLKSVYLYKQTSFASPRIPYVYIYIYLLVHVLHS